MPESSRPTPKSAGENGSGDADSRRGLWHAIRSFFDEDGETTLRAQIEEAISAAEDEGANGEREDDRNDLSPVELTMLRNLLHFSEHDADDVAIPRGEIIAVSADAEWDAMIAIFSEHGHSRLPVFRDTLDQVIGMIHIKDVFPYLAKGRTPPDWTVLMRQPLYVPQARGALDVLADMRSSRTHLAIVVDEFSGTDGIITIEDLVEEIVGNIEDEHDDAPIELVVPIGAGMWDADARAELDDVAKAIGDQRITEVEGAVDTIGGLAVELAEQVPQPGAVLTHSSGWRIEVTAGDETHVIRLRLHEPQIDSGAADES